MAQGALRTLVTWTGRKSQREGTDVHLWLIHSATLAKLTLEKGMATHSRILAWKIPRTEEPGGPQSKGLQKSWTQLSD